MSSILILSIVIIKDFYTLGRKPVSIKHYKERIAQTKRRESKPPNPSPYYTYLTIERHGSLGLIGFYGCWCSHVRS